MIKTTVETKVVRRGRNSTSQRRVQKIENQEEEFERVTTEVQSKIDKEKEDGVETIDGPPAPPRADRSEAEYEHHSTGKASDGKIYLSDIGEFRDSPRPKSEYTPEEWRRLPPKEIDIIIRREEIKEESEKHQRERKKEEI